MKERALELRASLVAHRRVVGAGVVVLLVLAIATATAGVFLLGPSPAASAPANLAAAGASAVNSGCSQTPSAGVSVAVLESASATPTASESLTPTPGAASTPTPKPQPVVTAAPTPTPTEARVTHGTVTFSASEGWHDTGIAVRNSDQLELTATGTYKVGSSDPGRTPGGVGCGGAAAGSGFLAPNLTKFAVVMKNDPPYPNALCVGGGVGIMGLSAGEIWVAINDDYFHDNSGTITINWTHVHM